MASVIHDEVVPAGTSRLMGWTPTAGNYLLFFRQAGGGATLLTSITQTNVGPWAAKGQANANRTVEIWMALVGSSPDTTLNFSTSVSGYLWEVTALPGTAQAGASGSTTNASPTTTVITASETPTASSPVFMVITGFRANTYSSGPTGGFTEPASVTGSGRVAYQDVPSASGAYSATWTYTGSSTYETYFLTLDANASGGGSTWGPALSDGWCRAVVGAG